MKLTPIQGPGVPSAGPDVQREAQAKARAVAVLENRASQPQPEPQRQPRQEVRQVSRQEVRQEVQAESQEPEYEQEVQAESDSLPVESESRAVTPDTSSELRALARRERALRQQAQKRSQEYKIRESELLAKEQALKSKEQSYETGYIPKEALKQNPLKVLADAGVSYDELTQAVLNQGAINPAQEAALSELKAEIRALREANEEIKAKQEETQTNQYQAAIKQIKQDAQALVRQDPQFELIRATRSLNDVVELITRTYDETGVVMDVEDAAMEVEKYLEQETEKLAKTKKLQQRFAGQQAQKPKAEEPKPRMKTLTNGNSHLSQLSPKERAILAFKGQLT
jgi:hypothetical protein